MGFFGGPSDSTISTLKNIGSTAGTQLGLGTRAINLAAAQTTPFYQQRMKNGLSFMPALTDYTAGQSAQSFAPARANIMRSTARMGTTAPSGYRDSLLNNLEAARARAYDSGITNNLMMNEQAKQAGAGGLMNTALARNPQGWAGIQGNAAMNTGQLESQKGSWGGFLGGIAGKGLGLLAQRYGASPG